MAIRAAVLQDKARSQGAFTNSPILRRSLVNITNGKTAKLNCMLRITWLKMSKSAVPFSPHNAVTTMAGAMAMLRVIRRRSQGRSEEHTSELQSQSNLVCRLLLEKKKRNGLAR